MRLDGKVAVITGAASGIGEASARRFIEEGCKVVLGDIQQERGQALANELGKNAVFQLCDVTQEDHVAALVDAAVEHFGQLNIMFNNAGIVGATGHIDEVVAAEWSATLDIMLNGVFYGLKHAARVMKPQGHGSIISMSSSCGVFGGQGPHAYTAAKHAIVGLTKNVAVDLAPHGIRVNAIAPGQMATELSANAMTGNPNDIAAAEAKIAANSPLKDRPGTALDVANAALFLASDEAGYTSGHILTTDAGVTIGATVDGLRFADRKAMIREAGRTGL